MDTSVPAVTIALAPALMPTSKMGMMGMPVPAGRGGRE
jgi:hypothetical protein